MSNESSAIVQKVWNYAHTLRADGISYGDYVEQITYLLFLKLAEEREDLGYDPPSLHYGVACNPIPEDYHWPELDRQSDDDLENHYRHTLEALGRESGLLGVIFRKAQNKIAIPANLK